MLAHFVNVSYGSEKNLDEFMKGVIITNHLVDGAYRRR